MRTLESALSDHDLPTLRVIGEWWELDLTGADKAECVRALAEHLGVLDLEEEMKYVPPEETAALLGLARAGGSIATGTFEREHGEIRQMGPGRLEREEPWLDPVSPAEALWYRGLIYKAFDDTTAAGDLVERVYLPEPFMRQLSALASPETEEETAQGPRPVAAPDMALPESNHAVDDLTTLLAFAQTEDVQQGGLSPLLPYFYDHDRRRLGLLAVLAEEMDLLRTQEGVLRPLRAAVAWLRMGREMQLQALAEAWSRSAWNELCQTPGIRCEGSGWSNEPILARTTLLETVARDQSWYAIDDIVNQIKEEDPDFQRPEGRYDSWYVRDIARDAYLKGFESWDEVEGRLLRFLIEGPMSWLGLCLTAEGKFRLTKRALSWMANEMPAEAEVQVPLVVRSDAAILVPYNATRYQRFQVARIATPEPLEPGEPYLYRLTPLSLRQAQDAGIEPERVIAFLREASERPIPASVQRALERWQERGAEARLQPAMVLRVRDAAILDTLQKNPKTRAYVGERLGDLAALVTNDKWQELQRVVAQLGLLIDVEI
jgi:hypothetical protein